ncbi:MAG: hypothetical protein KA314_11005 [Chloroflexi bacterium]|nr:hypothetical protein [Chloroflexota bacterium]MBP8056363.1 hypothetical protein [Chloroflexota bacterium]
MRLFYVSRPSQNRSPPTTWVNIFIVQVRQNLLLTLVSGLCGRCGRKLMYKENEKWL